MKIKNYLMIASAILVISCSKDSSEQENPENYNLLKKVSYTHSSYGNLNLEFSYSNEVFLN